MSNPLNPSSAAASNTTVDSATAASSAAENQTAVDTDFNARIRQLEQNMAEMVQQLRAKKTAGLAARPALSTSGSASKIGARRDGVFKAISSAPSFNWTPLSPTMVAIPYPTTSDLTGSLGLANSVKFNGQPAYTMGSYQPSGKGDEAGSGGGVRSGTVGGMVKPTSASSTVRADGKRIVREGDTNTMNGGNSIGRKNRHIVAISEGEIELK